MQVWGLRYRPFADSGCPGRVGLILQVKIT